MRSIFKSTSYANVTATLALVLALGGTSYAVTQVTGANVKNGSLTGKDIKKESLGSKQIKGLTAGDFSSPLPTGATGPAGPAGSAKAYAHISSTGTLDAPNSSGLVVTQHIPGGGVTCLNYTGGTPKNVVATVDVGGADSRKSLVSVLLGEAGAQSQFCPTGSDLVAFTARVDTLALSDLSYYIAVIA